MSKWKSISTNPLPALGQDVVIIVDDSYSGQYMIASLEELEERTGHDYAFTTDDERCFLPSEIIAWCELPDYPRRLLNTYRRGKSCQNSN